MAQQQQTPRDRRENGECIQKAVGGLELPTFVLAACLERFEEFLDRPASAIAVDGERDLFGGLDRQIGEEKPLDGRLSRGRLSLRYVDHIEGDRGRRGDRTTTRAWQLD